MIDLDSYQRQAEEGELHVTQVLALIAELRAIRAWLDRWERSPSLAAQTVAASVRKHVAEEARCRHCSGTGFRAMSSHLCDHCHPVLP